MEHWNRNHDAEGVLVVTGGSSATAHLGRAVFALARHAPAQHIYIAAEGVDRTSVASALRVFWSDALRRDYFALLGIVIDPQTMPARLFEEPRRARINAVLSPFRELPASSSGDRRSWCAGDGDADAGAISGRLTFPMLFYPSEEIQARVPAAVTRPWKSKKWVRPTWPAPWPV